MAKEVSERPTRYAGFAHVAMQDPKGAADELERCVRDLGFNGVMINHHTNGVYLDDQRNDVFWERLQALGVPLYLHPGDAFEMPHVLREVPELNKPVWEWTTEMSAHALRLVMTGVFDRFPRAQSILGHGGETLPYELWRLDSRYALTATVRRVKRPPSEYVRDNIAITMSGQFSNVPLPRPRSRRLARSGSCSRSTIRMNRRNLLDASWTTLRYRMMWAPASRMPMLKRCLGYGHKERVSECYRFGRSRPNTGKPVHRTIPKADVRRHLALAFSRPFRLKNT